MFAALHGASALPPQFGALASASPFKAATGALEFAEVAEEDRSSDEHYDARPQSVAKLMGERGACASWVPSFLGAAYFQPCDRHKHHKKNETTFYCITCSRGSVCQHCLGAHAGHQLLQVRRYVYCDVVRACDINPYVDTTGVQNYIINSAKVMFLNHRPHSKIGRANSSDTCRTCHRHLREGFSYCSLACKVETLTASGASACAPAPSGLLGARSGSVQLPVAPSDSFSRPAAPAAASAGTAIAPPAAPLSSPRASLGPFVAPFGAASASASVSATVARSGSGSGMMVETALAASCAAVSSSDAECSDPGGTVLYGSQRGTVEGMARAPPLVYGGSSARAASVRERLAGVGSSSEEEDEHERFEYHFENPPKRRRTALVRRQMSQPVTHDVAAASAAATLLLPLRSSSPVCPPPLLLSTDASVEEPSRGAPQPVSSRRKQHMPQRAPSV